MTVMEPKVPQIKMIEVIAFVAASEPGIYVSNPARLRNAITDLLHCRRSVCKDSRSVSQELKRHQFRSSFSGLSASLPDSRSPMQ